MGGNYQIIMTAGLSWCCHLLSSTFHEFRCVKSALNRLRTEDRQNWRGPAGRQPASWSVAFVCDKLKNRAARYVL